MKYDYQKAKQIIADNQDADVISLGMREDLGWTTDPIWTKEVGMKVNLDEKGLRIAGIEGSHWATPVAIIEKNGQEIIVDCFKEA